jgi:Flp pilus assembly protein protease CpaA
MWIKIGIISFSLIIFYQDIKQRQVSVIWLVLYSFLIVVLSFQHFQNDIWFQILLNGAFLVFQFFALSVYVSLKKGYWLWITQYGLGGADVFLLITYVFYFPFLNYLFFFFLSLIWVLMLSVAYTLFYKKKIAEQPFAGLQVILFNLLLVLELIFHFDLTSDSFMVNLISVQ